MKKPMFILIASVLLSSILVLSNIIRTANSESSLLGYWKFDEGSGTTAYDSSGNGNNGVLVNGPVWVDGKYGKALSFDGTDDYVAIPDLYTSSPSALTVSVWINSPLPSSGPIIHHCRNGEFTLENPFHEVVGFGVKLTNGEWYVVRGSSMANVWHHVVGVWTKGDSVKLYIDGILVNQISVPDLYLYNAYWLDAAIGSRYGWHAFFNGTIDEVKVYSRALSEEEIRMLFGLSYVSAAIDVNPYTLNLRSRGKWITAYIELPEGYDVDDINVSSILLNETVPAEPKPTAIGDFDSDGNPDLMVKFDRAAVISFILDNIDIEERFAAVTLTITGKLIEGTQFQGSDTIKIIMPMPRYWRLVEFY